MKIFYVDGLDCAHCAMKIEEKLNTLPGINGAALNFATGELRIQSNLDDTQLTEQIQTILKQLEPDAILRTQQLVSHQHGNSHNSCDCSDSCEEKRNKKHQLMPRLPLLLLGTAVLLLIPALMLKGSIASAVLFFLSGLAAGYQVFWKGLKKLRTLTLDENILLLIAFIAAFLIGEYFEACLVVILFSVGELLEDHAVERSKKSIEALTQIRPETAGVLRDGKIYELPCEDVQIGDTIVVKPGERIPLDCVVLSGNSQTDNAAITGESVPVPAAEGSALSSGGINLSSALTCRVTHSFVDSTASRIIEMVKDSAAKKGNAEAFISRFAKIYTPIVIIIALLLAVVPPLAGLGSYSQWVYTALVLLVAACPCAIVISVPLTFFSCIGAASRRGVLIKGGKYVEALAQSDAIAFDKTGTLTTGQLTVDKITPADESISRDALLMLAAACERYSTHPIAKAVLEAVPEEKLAGLDISDSTEIRGMGTSAVINGVKYLCGAGRMMEKAGLSLDGLPEANIYVADPVQKRVLGAISVKDTLRPESKSTLAQLKQLGIKTVMLLSGDRKEAVEACAKELKIECRAELLPENKVTAVEQLKTEHKKTAFVGDGINDAPVLAAADVGIAMGLGSDSAIEAADMVLVSGNLSSLPGGIRLAKKAMRIIYFNVVFALLAKLAVFILALFGLGQMWMAVFADVGVSIIAVLNAARLMKQK